MSRRDVRRHHQTLDTTITHHFPLKVRRPVSSSLPRGFVNCGEHRTEDCTIEIYPEEYGLKGAVLASHHLRCSLPPLVFLLWVPGNFLSLRTTWDVLTLYSAQNARRKGIGSGHGCECYAIVALKHLFSPRRKHSTSPSMQDLCL